MCYCSKTNGHRCYLYREQRISIENLKDLHAMIPKMSNIMAFLTCFQYMQRITFYSTFISVPSGWVYATNFKHIMYCNYCRLMKICRQVAFYKLYSDKTFMHVCNINHSRMLTVLLKKTLCKILHDVVCSWESFYCQNDKQQISKFS